MNVRVVAVVLVTAAALLGFGVAWLFFLLLAMNGFSERQAQPVFVGYFAIAALVVAACPALAGWAAAALPRRLDWPGWVIGGLSAVVASVGGALLLAGGGILLLVVFNPA